MFHETTSRRSRSSSPRRSAWSQTVHVLSLNVIAQPHHYRVYTNMQYRTARNFGARAITSGPVRPSGLSYMSLLGVTGGVRMVVVLSAWQGSPPWKVNALRTGGEGARVTFGRPWPAGNAGRGVVGTLLRCCVVGTVGCCGG